MDQKVRREAMGGFIIHDWKDRFLQATTFNLGAASVLMAGATTMRSGIKADVQARFTDIHIEGDNNILIQAVQGKIRTPWKIQVLVQDITTFFTQFNNIIINYIFRQGNSAADWLTKFELSVYSTSVLDAVPHMNLCRILVKDNLGEGHSNCNCYISYKKNHVQFIVLARRRGIYIEDCNFIIMYINYLTVD